jgi:hypothetical protein
MNVGSQLKEQGQELALAKAGEQWLDDVVSIINNWTVAHPRFYIEDVRDFIERGNGSQPHHPNVWGALTRRLKKVGYKLTGNHRCARRPSAHGRVVFEWERT